MIKTLRNFLGREQTSDSNTLLTGTGEEFESWCANLQMQINPANRVNVTARLLTAAARIGFFDWETRASVFNVAQGFGAHFLPVHFYSPVPDTATIPDTTWHQRFDDLPNLSINRDKLCGLLSELAIYGQELVDVTNEPSSELVSGVPNYHWDNVAFGGGGRIRSLFDAKKIKAKENY